MVLHRFDISDVIPGILGMKCVPLMELLLQSVELAPHKDNVARELKSTIVSKTTFEQKIAVIEIQYRSEGEHEPAGRGQFHPQSPCVLHEDL